MTPKEQTRLKILNSLLAQHMTLDQAATLMGVSPRHTRRILAAYHEKGAATVAHGLRGRKPADATPEPVATAVVHLAHTRYAGTNHTHLSELLSERDGIDIGRTTLRRILVNAGLSSPRRRRQPKHRVRRQRMPRQGMLIQMDGSHHPWLGDRMPPFTLLIAVDDATGTVVDALFCKKEDAHSYFLLIQRLLQRRGIPLALYTDRHGVFRHAPGSGLPGMPTQFSRAMDELGIQMIFALSPQAKGRVERMAETFQDRLVTELRLAGASTIDQAKEVLQEFLPKFSARFAVAAEHPETAYRPVPAELSLIETICIKDTRKVARDNTVKYHWRVLQLFPGADRPSYAGLRVEVLERADGELMIRYHGETVDFQEAPPPSSALWGLAGPCSPGPELQKVAGGPANGHFNEAQRKLLAALETADEEEADVKGAAVKGEGGKGKPVRHSLHRAPTPTQQARCEAVQQAREKGLSLGAIARKLGMSRVATRKYAVAESPPTKLLST